MEYNGFCELLFLVNKNVFLKFNIVIFMNCIFDMGLLKQNKVEMLELRMLELFYIVFYGRVLR